MPPECTNVTANSTIDCANPWGDGCTSKLHFEFPSIWNFTQQIHERCPTDDRLFKHANGTHLRALTQTACEHIAGSGFNKYPGSIVWTRLTTWKFPLLQLVAQFQRPPLGFWAEAFVMAHLLGDPVDTNKNLLHKLARCQTWAYHWKDRSSWVLDAEEPPESSSEGDEDNVDKEVVDQRDRWWKALTLMTDAYDEWGEGEVAKRMLIEALNKLKNASRADKRAFRDLVFETADALAADRATKHLPIWVALTFFVAQIIVAYARTLHAIGGDSFNTTIFINLEMHGIAFTSLYFWIIPAVFMSSVIGVSQTEERIRAILKQFHKNLKDFANLRNVERPSIGIDGKGENRLFNGGIYSWKPIDWHSDLTQELKPLPDRGRDPHRAPAIPPLNFQNPALGEQQQPQQLDHPDSAARLLNAGTSKKKFQPDTATLHCLKKWLESHSPGQYLIVLLPLLTGTVLSSTIPPEVINCRVWSELGIFALWLASPQLDFIFEYLVTPSKKTDNKIFRCIPICKHEKRNKLFWYVYIKDVIFTLATIIFVFLTVWGCLNACSCWMDKDTGLIMPQRPDIDQILKARMKLHYPAFIFSGLAIELIVIPLIVWWKYPLALRAFVQRDDGKSNAEWYHRVALWLSKWTSRSRSEKRGKLKMNNVNSIDPWGNQAGMPLHAVSDDAEIRQ